MTPTSRSAPRVLLTSVGGLVIPGMIRNLREAFGEGLHVVGVDMDEEAIGRQLVDAFHRVPPGLDPDFPQVIEEVVVAEDVDVLVPLSDEEAIALADAKERLRRHDAAVACSEPAIVHLATDKGAMLTALSEAGVVGPDFRVPKTLSELDAAVAELGYPDRRLVLKPTRARGARGVWILDAAVEGQDFLLRDRARTRIRWELARSLLVEGEALPPVVVMEYLPGMDFNVDLLCRGGEMLYCLAMERVVPDVGPVQVGRIRIDARIEERSREIAAAFGFDYNVNLEFAYADDLDRGPLLYEINPRISAPIAASRRAGFDLMEAGIRMALGETLEAPQPPREILMRRAWMELYEAGAPAS